MGSNCLCGSRLAAGYSLGFLVDAIALPLAEEFDRCATVEMRVGRYEPRRFTEGRGIHDREYEPKAWDEPVGGAFVKLPAGELQVTTILNGEQFACLRRPVNDWPRPRDEDSSLVGAYRLARIAARFAASRAAFSARILASSALSAAQSRAAGRTSSRITVRIEERRSSPRLPLNSSNRAGMEALGLPALVFFMALRVRRVS